MSEQETQESSEISSEEVDSLYSEATGSRDDSRGNFEMDEAKTNVDPEFDIVYKGESKKLPLSKLRELAQQGYDYSQKMGSFNKERADFDNRLKEFDSRYERFSELDKYVAENPDWWSHVNDSWANRGNPQQEALQSVAPSTQEELTTDPKVLEYIEALKNEVDGLKSFKDTVEEERVAKVRAEEDRKYDTELNEIREAYPGVDFDKLDEQGESLEYKVLKHANENGIQSFRTAFRDFYHDDLMKMSQTKAKEQFARDSQQIKKYGLSQSTEPTVKPQINGSVKSKSYDDLVREAKEELGI